jgi:hypothetical protein
MEMVFPNRKNRPRYERRREWGKRIEKGEGRMRTFIFALAAIVPAFAIDRAGAADELPAFDIERRSRRAERADRAMRLRVPAT